SNASFELVAPSGLHEAYAARVSNVAVAKALAAALAEEESESARAPSSFTAPASTSDDFAITSPERHSRKVRNQKGVAAVEMILVSLVLALLMAFAVPRFITTTPKSNDLVAKANLMNAVLEAKVVYSTVQSYSSNGGAYPSITFATEAPGFSWSSGSCSGANSNCVSEKVVDVNAAGDSQGVVLATWSSTTRTCWYAVDLESVPSEITSDTIGIPFDNASNGNGAVNSAGVFFGKSSDGSSSCDAVNAVDGFTLAPSGWSSSIQSAGLVGQTEPHGTD
ncbi:MAG: hypothetical protein WAM97_00405, partial [Acidimicrobiales bacterium]